MGLLSKLFGGKEYPPLASSPEAAKFEPYRQIAEAFAAKLHDRIEVIPTDHGVLYCFIGNPPDQFGIAWFEGTEEHNLKTLMKAKGLQQARVQSLSDEIRRAYVKSASEPRYEIQLGKKKVTVTPSRTLEQDLVNIIHKAEH